MKDLSIGEQDDIVMVLADYGIEVQDIEQLDHNLTVFLIYKTSRDMSSQIAVVLEGEFPQYDYQII